jgi:hypothetical protein
MHETAGEGAAGALGRRYPQHELLAGPGLLRQEFAVFEKNAAAVRGVRTGVTACFESAHERPSMTASSTAMRTATPLRT